MILSIIRFHRIKKTLELKKSFRNYPKIKRRFNEYATQSHDYFLKVCQPIQ
jgi:hypothetical protein